MKPRIWFPAIRTGAGVDIFTQRLSDGLRARGMQTEITWLPHRAEYAPFSVRPPTPPAWANVVHINSWTPPSFLPDALPCVVTVHNCVHEPAFRQYQSLAQRAYHRHWVRRIEERNIRHGNIVTAVSAYTAAQTAQAFNLPSAPRVIHNWVDSERFVPAEVPRTAGAFQLVFIGNHSRRKGFDLLPEIMRRLGPDCHLKVSPGASRSVDRGDWPENMGELGQCGPLKESEVIQALQAADALVFPTRLEGFGLVALEAMACGLPVIATRGSALPEVVEDGVSGILCARDDVASFIDAIITLRDDAGMRERMGQKARERACSSFLGGELIGAYEQIYRSVLAA